MRLYTCCLKHAGPAVEPETAKAEIDELKAENRLPLTVSGACNSELPMNFQSHLELNASKHHQGHPWPGPQTMTNMPEAKTPFMPQ